MGLTLAQLFRVMTSAEFSLRLQLELQRQQSSAPAEPESDWCDGM